MNVVQSERLELIPASIESCDAEASGPAALAVCLAARVPASWPPPVFESDDVARIRRQLEADSAAGSWTLHYVFARPRTVEGRQLVGVAGFTGPPTPEGEVEIGYAIASEYQRRGYATEAVDALVTAAFRDPRVVVVSATTYPTLEASIRVLTRCGFTRVGDQEADGTISYVRRRAADAPGPAAWPSFGGETERPPLSGPQETMDFAIRPGMPEDAPTLSALALRAKSSWGYPAGWIELWRDALTIRPEYLAGHRSLVAVRRDQIVGVCVIEVRGQDASLEHVWVAPELQKRGVGRALVQEALGVAARAGARRVEVESDPFAETFYLRLGARRHGERAAPMPGAPERVLPLLEFVLA